jgi:integrase
MSKSVLSGACQFAARRDLLPRNPVRDTGTISTTPRRAPNALSVAQVRDLRTWLTYDDTAIRRDLPDLVAFMLATGLRISEASAVRWACVDLDASTVHVTASIVRVKGRGLVLQEADSGKLTTRTLQLPPGASTCSAAATTTRTRTRRHPSSPPPRAGSATPTTPRPTSATPSPAAATAGSPPTSSAAPSPPSWTRPACPDAPQPTNSATPNPA